MGPSGNPVGAPRILDDVQVLNILGDYPVEVESMHLYPDRRHESKVRKGMDLNFALNS